MAGVWGEIIMILEGFYKVPEMILRKLWEAYGIWEDSDDSERILKGF